VIAKRDVIQKVRMRYSVLRRYIGDAGIVGHIPLIHHIEHATIFVQVIILGIIETVVPDRYHRTREVARTNVYIVLVAQSGIVQHVVA